MAQTLPAPRPFRPAAALWLIALGALLPFAVAAIPSMTDLPGHIGRYAVMADAGRSEWLALYWQFDWRLVGNLGVDLLVRALAPLTGVERAAWAASAAIAPLTVAGIAAVSRALHGRVQPTAAAASVFVLANPLMFGFVNYALAVALALCAFAGWIVLRARPAALHLALLLPAATLVWLAHAMGWGMLVLLVAGFEMARLWARRSPAALADTLLRGLALLPPLVLTLAWRGEGGGALYAYGSDLLVRKAMNWIVLLRGGEKWIDLATPLLLGAVTLLLLWRRALRPDPRLAIGAALLALACCLMPTTLFGSWGADERLAPASVIAALVSLRWHGSPRAAAALIALSLALFAVRTGLIARNWHRLDTAYASHLSGLERLPRGARIHALVLKDECHKDWASTAYNHLPSLAIGRREALVNSEWKLPGAALLSVRYPIAPNLANDPSQLVSGYRCSGPEEIAFRRRLADPGLARFQYLWLLETHGRDWWPGHRPLYRDANSAIYALPGG
jgi:hypothetical protein